MGIQINGQTDTIKAIDGTMTMPGTVTYEDVSRVNVTGIVTAGQGLHVTSGSAGIGTDNPAATLHVKSSGATEIRSESTGDNALININNSSAVPWILTQRSDTANAFSFRYSGNNYVNINTSGNLGIGLTNPDKDLTIASSRPTIKLIDDDVANNAAFATIDVSSHAGLLFECDPDNVRSSTDIRFNIDAEERLRITPDGNIGINTENPYNSAGYTSLTIDDSTGSQIRMRTAGNERALIYNTDTEFGIYAHNNIPINLYGSGRVLATLDYEGQLILNSQTNQSYALWRKQSPITLAQYGDYARPVVALSYHRSTGSVNASGFFGDVIAFRGSTGAGHIPIFLRVCVSSAYTTNMRSSLGLGSSTFRFVTFDYDGSSYQGIQYNTDASANILLDGWYATRGFKPFSLAQSSVTNITAVNATTDGRLSSTSSGTV